MDNSPGSQCNIDKRNLTMQGKLGNILFINVAIKGGKRYRAKRCAKLTGQQKENGILLWLGVAEESRKQEVSWWNILLR